MILVPLVEPEVRNWSCGTMHANVGLGVQMVAKTMSAEAICGEETPRRKVRHRKGRRTLEQPAFAPRSMDMLSRVIWYRERAAEARRRAAETRDPSIKSAYEQMARDWAMLAEQVEWIENQRRSPPTRKTDLPT